MRTILYCFFLLIFSFNLKAQTSFLENHHMYTKFGGSLGTHFGVDASYNYIYQKKYSVEFGGRAYFQRSELKPDDYKSGLFDAFSFGFGNGNDYYSEVYLLFGQVFPLKGFNSSRIHIKGGIAYTQVNQAVNFQQSFALLGANYTYDMHRYHTASFILMPTFEFPCTQFIGVYFSPHIIANKATIYYGIGCGLQIGLLRGKDKSKDKY